MGRAHKPDGTIVDCERSLRSKLGSVTLIASMVIVPGLTGIVYPLIKEKFLDTPDYRINAKIEAPLAKVDTWLVNEKTGKKIYLPNGVGPNPIEVRLKNTGKKPIEKVEVILEFVATGDFRLFDERYSVKPKKGFGKINFTTPKNTERCVGFDLFNPGDELIYFGTGTRPVTVIAYSRFPGLSFYQEYSPVGKYDSMIRLSMISLIGLSACYGIFLFCFVQKQIIEQYGIRNILSRGFVNVYWNDRTKTERLFFWAGLNLAIFSCLILTILISGT